METKLIHISSFSGDIYNNGNKLSDISFNIPNFINNNENVKETYFSVLKAEFPVSFYLVNEWNNILTLEVNNIETTYTLTEGNYNVNNFIKTLSDTLGVLYSLSYNSIKNKITITTSFEFKIIISKTTMARFLGIYDEIDTTSTLEGSIYSITSPYVCNFLPQQRIHLRTNDIILDSYNAFDKSNDIFLSLQNTSAVNGIIIYNNNDNLRLLLNDEKLNGITIKITDDRNRLINFNNVNWYLTFRIDYIYYERPLKGSLNRFFKTNQKDFGLKYLELLGDSRFEELKSFFQQNNFKDN